MDINEAPIRVQGSKLRPMAKTIANHAIEKGTNMRVFSVLRGAGKKVKKIKDKDKDGPMVVQIEDLRKWFGKGKKGDWVRVGTDGEIKGDCARDEGEGKPKCMPRSKAHSMKKKDRASAARRKRAADPDVDRPGTGNKPIMVKTDKKESVVHEDVNVKSIEKFKAAARDFDKNKDINFQSIADALSRIVTAVRMLDKSTSGRTDYKYEQIISKESTRINNIVNKLNYGKGGATPEGKEIVKLLNKHGLNRPFRTIIFEGVYTLTVKGVAPGGRDLNTKISGKDKLDAVKQWRKKNPKYKNDQISVSESTDIVELTEATIEGTFVKLAKELDDQANKKLPPREKDGKPQFTGVSYPITMTGGGRNARVWTRGDGSKYRKPAKIVSDLDHSMYAKVLKDYKKVMGGTPVDMAWKFITSKGKSLGKATGELGSDKPAPAYQWNGTVFIKRGSESIDIVTPSIFRNSWVWRTVKEEVEMNEESRLQFGDKVKTPQGTVEIRKRDTRGMRGKQDAYALVLHMKNGKKASMGSHPAPTASAVTNMAKRFKDGVPSYMAHLKVESVDLEEKNVPTNPKLWAKFKAQAKAKFDVYPSAYANGWASKQYKAAGGGWKSVKEDLEEKAVSKAQQKFFGMVRAKQKGEMDNASPEVKKAADTMSKKDVKDFAKTKHKGLPDKKVDEDAKKMATKDKKRYRSASQNKSFKGFRDRLREEDPCWDTHKQVGTKMKGGKQVPNCVPK